MKFSKHTNVSMKVKRTLAILPVTAILAVAPALVLAAPGSYSMVVLDRAPQASKLKSGDYAITMAAVERLEAETYRSFDMYNNLCVGYTITRSFDKAEAACDMAVEQHTDTSRTYHSFRAPGMGLSVSDRKAIALSNRGVLKAVTGDAVGAREDFAVAAESSADISESGSNLAYLTSKSVGPEGIAQAGR